MTESKANQPLNPELQKAGSETAPTSTELVFGVLTEMGAKEGKAVSIENKGGFYEIFKYGDEDAIIKKIPTGGSIGGSGDRVQNYIEGYEYKRLAWWNKAIQEAHAKYGLSFGVLDTPLARAASDAGLMDSTYMPGRLAKEHNLDPNELTRRIIRNCIKENISPILGPHYTVSFQNEALRLIARTPEGIESRTKDNDVYLKASQKLKDAAPLLQEKYKALFNKTE